MRTIFTLLLLLATSVKAGTYLDSYTVTSNAIPITQRTSSQQLFYSPYRTVVEVADGEALHLKYFHNEVSADEWQVTSTLGSGYTGSHWKDGFEKTGNSSSPPNRVGTYKSYLAFSSLGAILESHEVVNGAQTRVYYGPGTLSIRKQNAIKIWYTDFSDIVAGDWSYSATDRIIYNISSVDSNSEGNNEFSVALDDDGSRLAIGSKDGTNTLVRVYEYDGSSWSQLGEDVEQ